MGLLHTSSIKIEAWYSIVCGTECEDQDLGVPSSVGLNVRTRIFSEESTETAYSS